MKPCNLFLLAILVFSATLVFGQNLNFERGYKEGFGKGYCFNQSVNCIEKTPMIIPIPKVNESSESYLDGYNRGFSEGLNYKRNETSSQGTISKEEIKFNAYISQIPSNSLNILAYKQKLFSERKEWITNSMNEIHDFLTNKFLKFDAAETKKFYDLILDFQNKLGENWPDLSEESIFNPLKLYLTNYTTSLDRTYKKLMNEAESNTINFRGAEFSNVPPKWIVLISLNSIEDCEGILVYGIGKEMKIDEKVIPNFSKKYSVIRDGKKTEFYILHFEKYDTYVSFFKDEIEFSKDNTDGFKFIVTATVYENGGRGNPLFIPVSESMNIILDNGRLISTNYLGVSRFKINMYNGNGAFIESKYHKSKCWQDKVSGKKYFLNSGYLQVQELFKDELLLTSNVY